MAISTLTVTSLSENQDWLLSACILAALTLIGEKYIRRAMAQFSGTMFSPVAFSFGWVSYSFQMLALALGNSMLMPKPDTPSIVISGIAGHPRDNLSWILWRLLKDFQYWMPKEVRDRLEKMLEDVSKKDAEREAEKGNEAPPPRAQAGLCVSVFRARPLKRNGPALDLVRSSGVLVTGIQLGIALIPRNIRGDWSVLYVTGAGILLAYLTGALPRWRKEKWDCPKMKNTVILTRGNGAQHALVIFCEKGFYNLEILANLQPRMDILTQLSAVGLASLWLLHLTATVLFFNMKENIPYMMMIGGIGMMYNMIATELPRRPEAYGLDMDFEECIVDAKVMDVLKETEKTHPGVGGSMLKTFFPGPLWESDKPFWAEVQKQFPLLELIS